MTGPRTRRTLLRTGALALSAGLAGCVGGLGDDTGDDTQNATTAETRAPTRSATRTTDANSETTTTAEPPLAVEAVRVQSSFFYLTTPDSAAVASSTETQFVFVDVRETTSSVLPPLSDDFTLVTSEDRRFDGTYEPGAASDPWSLYWQGPAYDPDEHGGGWVAFEVPDPLDAENVALTYESEGRRFSVSLDPKTVESLAEPPAEFELVGFDYPESVERYERFEVSVVVENVGEGDGVFRAALNQTYPLYAPYPVEVSVPAGERREWSETSNWSLHGDADRAQFTLLTPTEKRGATVEVVAETTGEA